MISPAGELDQLDEGAQLSDITALIFVLDVISNSQTHDYKAADARLSSVALITNRSGSSTTATLLQQANPACTRHEMQDAAGAHSRACFSSCECSLILQVDHRGHCTAHNQLYIITARLAKMHGPAQHSTAHKYTALND
jgi:hypothetical protein